MKTTNGVLLGRAMIKGFCYLVLAACWLVICPQAQASPSHPAVVSENPADTTPHILLDGGSQRILAFEQVGRTMYAGGQFNEVLDPTMTTAYSRQNFVAFDCETGVISPLTLSFDGIVTGIEASEDGTALFISGAFAKVNGITRRGIAKYDLVNDRIDPTFAPKGMRTVSDIKFANGALIAAGNFPKRLMAMDPTTGEDLGTINITVAGVVDPTDETRVMRIAVSPDGTRLVATGNFATVNGQSRRRAFMLNLGPTATLSTWHVPRFDVNCAASSRLVSAQGVDFSPDGRYFVIVATGGPTGTNGICDAAARFETADVSSTVQPTWINWTGGDSLWSVAVTGAAVYVGGHQRWLDNPYGYDSAGAGAVSRPGIGAIDPGTGSALPWNPTKSRNDGTRALLATPDGLWVGSDGERFGSEDHAGIGFAPLDLSPTPDTTRPDTFIDSGPSGPVFDTSATFGFSANEPSTFQCRLDGAAFAPCTSPLSYENLSEGSHTFQVVAVDGSYNMDASPAEQSWTVVAPGGELIGNPGFEVDTSGWRGDASANTLTRVAGGHSGGWAVQVSNAVAGGTCGLDDNPNWVSSTEGGSYTASIWARSDTPGVPLKLRVREYAGGARQGTVTGTLALTSSWQQVTVNYTPVAPGSTLDFEAYTSNAPAGVCFQADDASITLTGNAPPTVDAGPDQSVALPVSAVLDGTVTDDGLPDPPGVVNVSWRLVSGPGLVNFADANAADTTASFSEAGTYVLRLTADDGEFQPSDEVTVVVSGSSGIEVVDVRVAAGSDDAEEKVTGGMRMTSTDLDLVYDGGDQTVGMRFNGLDIPQGATIANAYVQFRTDQANSEPTSLTIRGEAVDNAATFSNVKYNISSRPTTSADVPWSPVEWSTVGEAGDAQKTPDISSIIQEIVDRGGWTSGNSLVIIITGTGLRTAEAFEGVAVGAPLLHVEYDTGP